MCLENYHGRVPAKFHKRLCRVSKPWSCFHMTDDWFTKMWPHLVIAHECLWKMWHYMCLHSKKEAVLWLVPEECVLECPSGYLQDSHGNKLCECVMSHDCPALTSCHKNCSHGFRLNKAGSEFCKCRECRPLTDCNKNCVHWLHTNDRGCQICKCKGQYNLLAFDNPLPFLRRSCALMSSMHVRIFL
jgi:hypothetical protein